MRALLLSLIFCALTQMGLTAAELHLKNDLTGTQLQHLIEQANAGDTIIIEEKAFLSAPLVIDKPLSILGSHKEASQILVKLEAPLPVGTSALTIQSSGVSIETLSIKHHEDSQMYDCLISCFGAFENIRLYNLNLDVNKKGIYFDYGAGEIESCTFSVLGALAEDMITLCGLIQDISIKNNKIDGNESGLRRCTFIKVRDTDDEGTAPLRGALRIVGNYLAENKNSFINVFFKYMGFHTNKQGISLEGKFNKIHAREAFLFAFDANARLDYFNQIHLEGNTLSTPRSYNGLLHFTAQDTTYPSQWVLSNNLINLFVLKNNVTPYTTAQHVLRPDLEYPDEQKLFALDRSFFKNHTAADLPTTPFVDVQLSDDLKNIIEHSPDSIVRLAPGNHTLSHTIHVPNDLCLVGMGSDPSACTLHISSGWSDTDSPLFSLADNHSTIIRNLAVEPENSSDITNYPKQLLVSSGQSPLILQNTKLSYVTNAVFTTSHDIYINQCTFTALEDPTPTSSAVYLDVNEEAPINYVFCYNTGTHLGASYKDRNFLFINFSRLNLNSLQGPEDASSAPPTKTQLQTYYIYQNELHQPVESFLKMHYTQGHPKTGSNYAFHHYPHPVLQNIYLRKNINIPAQALLTLVNLPGSPLTSSSSEYFPWFFVEDNSLSLQNIPYRGEISCIGGAPFKGEQKIDANLIAFHVYYQAHESLEKLDAFLPLYHESRKDTLALSNLKIEQHFQTLLQTPRVAFLNTAYKDTVFDKQEAARKAAEEAARKAAEEAARKAAEEAARKAAEEAARKAAEEAARKAAEEAARKAAEEAARKAAEDAARKAAEDAARKAAAIAAQATSQPLVSHQPTLLAARESASSLSKQNIPQNLAATPSVTSPQTQTPSQTPPPSQTLPRVQPGKYSPPPRKSLPFHHTSVNVPQGPSKESSDTIPQPQSKYLQGRHPISVPTSVKNIPFSNTNINTQQKNDPIHHSSPKEGIKTKEAKGSTNKESIPLKTKVPVEQQNTKPAPLNPTPAPSNMTVAVNSPSRGVRPMASGLIHTSSTINTQNARKHTSSTILDPSQKVAEEKFLQTTRNIALEPVTAVSVQTVTHKLPTHEYKYYLIKWTAKTRPGQVFKIYENGKFSTSIPGNSLETYSVSIPKGSSNSPVIEIFPVFGASTGPGTKVQP